MLDFYNHPLSPWAKQVHLILEEVGLPYQEKALDLQNGEQRRAPFKQISPYGRVPAISVDGFNLSESGAIVRYLVQKTERFDLYPASLEDRAQVEQWTEFLNRHINKPLVDLYWNRTMVYKFGGTPDAALIEKSDKNLKRDFAALEEHLVGRNYLVGASCTLADLMVLPFLSFWKEAGWDMAPYPAASAWLARLSERKSWKRFS